MLVSSTSMNAAKATTTAISQGLNFGRQTSASIGMDLAELIGHNIRYDVHTWPQLMVPVVLLRLEDDLYWNPLHDLDVVPCGIFRRKQAEQRPGGSGNAVHMTLESSAAGIHVNLCLLPHSHVLKLGLFEVGGDPHFLERDDCEQLLTRLYLAMFVRPSGKGAF